MTEDPGRRRADSPAPDEPATQAPRLTVDRRMAGATSRNVFIALQMVATLFATLGGIAFYLLLLSSGLDRIWALLLGLAFALISRRAITALMLEWLLARARRAAQGRDAPDAGGRHDGDR